MYEQQSKDSLKKTVFTKFERCSCARKRSVPFLTFHTFTCKLEGKNYRQMYGRLKLRRNVFYHSYIPQIWSIQFFAWYFNAAVHKFFRIYFLRKLFAIIFPYKRNKFGTAISIYPECNAWRHLFAYRGLSAANPKPK